MDLHRLVRFAHRCDVDELSTIAASVDRHRGSGPILWIACGGSGRRGFGGTVWDHRARVGDSDDSNPGLDQADPKRPCARQD